MRRVSIFRIEAPTSLITIKGKLFIVRGNFGQT